MIKNKKVYALLLSLSIACAGTYSSYAYFTSQSIESGNKISIGQLEAEEGVQELVEASIKENVLELKFSKRLFFQSENIIEGISGDSDITENIEVSMNGNSLFIKKLNGNWTLPKNKEEKNLPKISIENFEDRFGNKINPQDIYLYEGDEFALTGNVGYIVSNKGSITDAEILSTSIPGVSAIQGVFANSQLNFINSEDDIVTMNIDVQSKAETEEFANGKIIKLIPTYGTDAYSEWVGDTLEVYLCYDVEYTEADIQRIVDEVINIDINLLRSHEFGITRVNVKFDDNTKLLKPTMETEESVCVLGGAKNTIAGKNTRGSISINSIANTTGRFKVKITDSEGIIAEETFLSIKDETQKQLMTKISSTVLSKFDTKKYMIAVKDGGTRLDITSKSAINTGLTIEIEKL